MDTDKADALKANRELRNYQFAINQHSIVVFTSKKGRITYVNDKFCELSKYSQEELIGQDHRIINSGHHSKEFMRDLLKTIHSGEIWKGEIKNKSKDGTYYWVATTITPVKDDEGVITDFIAVRTDITENKRIEEELIKQNQELLETKQALQDTIDELKQKNQKLSDTNALLKESEQKLAESNARFELAAGESKIGVWDRDLVNDYSVWDERMYALFGLKNQSIDIDGVIWRDFIHPDDLEGIDHAFQQALTKTDKLDLEYRVVWEDGSIHYLHANAIVHRNNKNEPIRLIGTVRDVTDQKLAEIALLESQEALAISNTRFQLAVNAANIGISDRDLVNNTVFWDDKFYALVGVKDKNSIDVSATNIWHQFVHPDDWHIVDQARKDVFEQSHSLLNIDFRVIWEDGSIHYLQSSGAVQRDKDGNAIRLITTMMDISNQKMVEDALRQSEAKYRRDNLLLEESQSVAKLGGWELDINTSQLYWTAETYKIHETSPEEFNPTVETRMGYYLPESRKIISAALEVAMTKGEGYDLNLETYTTKGRRIDVRTTCAVTMHDGKPVKLTGILQDITEQKKAQNEIETSNTRLSIAKEAAKFGIWEFFLEDQRLIWDDKMFELFDVPQDTFSGTYEAWRATVHLDDLEGSERELEHAIATEQSFNSEFRIVWQDKSIHHMKGMAEFVRDENGKAYKMIGVNYDITEQKKREHEIEVSNARLNLATQSANIGIWEFFIEEDILIWEDQTLALFGLTRDSFSGNYEGWKSTVHPEDLEEAEQKIREAIADKSVLSIEFRTIWPDKSIHYIGAYGKAVLDETGKTVILIGTNYDVTDRVQREIDLKNAKEKAEESDRLKSAFLANMRHEIRNPMNAIVGFSRQMAQPQTTEAQRAEYSSIVINSSKQLLAIIDDITSISLLETKQEHINKSEVNINDLLSELKTQFAQQAKTRNLKLTLSKSLPNEQAVISTDKSKLTRVITNLLTNALKFTHEGSIKFGYKVNKEDLLFYVKDTGIGIAADYREKIFESFQQADGGISRKYGGTGLGLSICKGLTEIIGGEIWLESEVNKGSTFYISLPFSQVNYSAITSIASKSDGLKTKIIIAEDQLINFHYLKILFEKSFVCDILHASNGEEAVELTKKNPETKFVLMDISMPVMDGFEAARLIREIKPDLPIIAQTGYDIESNKKYSPTIFTGYVSKPIDETTLLSKAAPYLKAIK